MSVKSISVRLRKLDSYGKTVLVILPISLILLAILYGLDSTELLSKNWFLDLLPPFALIGSLVSGSTYFATSMTIRQTREKDYSTHKSYFNREYIGTVLGVTVGLVIGIVLSLLNVSLPFTAALCGLANTFFVVTQIGIFGGIGNRLGSCVDKKSMRLSSEVYVISLTALASVIIGSVIFALFAATCLTGGAALPLWFAGILFVSSFTSTMISTADYATKARNYIYANSTTDEVVKKVVLKRKNEYRGSLGGVSIGLCIGIVVLAMLVIAQPYLFVGLMGVITAVTIITTSISILGGLCSRMGRFLDGFKITNNQIKMTPEQSGNKHDEVKSCKAQTHLYLSKRLTEESKVNDLSVQTTGKSMMLNNEESDLFTASSPILPDKILANKHEMNTVLLSTYQVLLFSTIQSKTKELVDSNFKMKI